MFVTSSKVEVHKLIRCKIIDILLELMVWCKIFEDFPALTWNCELDVVLLWRKVWSGQVCEDCSAGWDVLDSSNRSICCCRMEFWVCNSFFAMISFWVLNNSFKLQCLMVDILNNVNQFYKVDCNFIILNHSCMLQWCAGVAALCSRHGIPDLQSAFYGMYLCFDL